MKQVDWSGKKVLKEEEWSRIYELDDGTPIRVSKFLTDEIEISEEKLKKDWSAWSESQQLAFVHAFGRKLLYSVEDERLLDFLMNSDNERILESIAISLTRHSKKQRACDFLIHRLRSSSGAKANYAHALGILGNSSAVPALRTLHDELDASISKRQDDVDVGTVLDFVSCCSALNKIEGSSVYKDEIRSFLNHPNQVIRNFAKVFLEGGPPSQ
jgi:hypothetical protein